MKLDIKFISCDYQGGNSFTRSEIDHLWNQGVNMDDWDYAIICTPHILEEETYEAEGQEFVFFPHIPENEREQYITKEYIDHRGLTYKTYDVDYSKGEYQKVIKTYKRYNCIDYNLDRMLTGCCHNEWYLIEWNSEKKAIGVAYHA
jgi:hypothetical protein